MRRKPRLDLNQPGIVKTLRDLPGISVQSLAAVGGGVPDIVVGYKGRNYLVEIKNANMPASGRQLTPAESAWHQNWTGQVAICETVSSILKQIGYPLSKLSASKLSDLDRTLDNLDSALPRS